MPVYRNFSDENATVLVWKYEETEHFDLKELLEEENYEKIKDYHPKKLSETLMVRKILKKVLPEYKILYNGREPYLEPRDYEISISHSFPYAALAISKNKVGIDLEPFNPKILKIKDKFVFPQERTFIPDDEEVKFLTIIWCVKESLYKIHHSNYWSLIKHYEVKPFTDENLHFIKCRVHDQQFSDEYKAKIFFFDNYCFSIVD